ncbi:hypothetical protein GCM10018791_38550 [Streptomyces zaomyceticus]|nr:hypothetical protein GCM10018791_38550 [Streptomyces zaomyceticus]
MASLGRVAYLRYVVGPRTSACDRTAGDSSPVAQKERSVPGTPGAGRNRLFPSRRTRDLTPCGTPEPRPVPFPTRRDPPAPPRSAPPLP